LFSEQPQARSANARRLRNVRTRREDKGDSKLQQWFTTGE